MTANSACSSGTYDSGAGTCTETKVTNFATYARTTTVSTDSTLPGCTTVSAASCTSREVTVEVTYFAVGDSGTSYGGKVTLATIISRRP